MSKRYMLWIILFVSLAISQQSDDCLLCNDEFLVLNMSYETGTLDIIEFNHLEYTQHIRYIKLNHSFEFLANGLIGDVRVEQDHKVILQKSLEPGTIYIPAADNKSHLYTIRYKTNDVTETLPAVLYPFSEYVVGIPDFALEPGSCFGVIVRTDYFDMESRAELRFPIYTEVLGQLGYYTMKAARFGKEYRPVDVCFSPDRLSVSGATVTIEGLPTQYDRVVATGSVSFTYALFPAKFLFVVNAAFILFVSFFNFRTIYARDDYVKSALKNIYVEIMPVYVLIELTVGLTQLSRPLYPTLFDLVILIPIGFAIFYREGSKKVLRWIKNCLFWSLQKIKRTLFWS